MSFVAVTFGVIQAIFSILVLFKTCLSLVGARYEIFEPVSSEEVNALEEKDLPVYTVLIPAYKEPESVIISLVNSLKRLDYP